MFKRGFKTWCENTAGSYRRRLNLKKQDPLNPFSLAEHLQIKVITPNDLIELSAEAKNILLHSAASSWSAATLSIDGTTVIIYNPSHVSVRQSNDIMHEISHVIIGHNPQMMHSYETGMFLRTYDALQEKEADWLAAALLLPKEALISILYSKTTHDAAAKHYGVSKPLLTMRLAVSGVNYIYTRSKQTSS